MLQGDNKGLFASMSRGLTFFAAVGSTVLFGSFTTQSWAQQSAKQDACNESNYTISTVDGPSSFKSTARLNVRKGPSKNCTIIEILPNRQIVTKLKSIQTPEREWAYIRWFEEGVNKFGWASGKFLAENDSPAKLTKPKKADAEQTSGAAALPAATPQKSEVSESRIRKPDVAKRDVAKRDVAKPDVAKPDVVEPKVVEPKVVEPKVTEPKVTEPKVTEPKVTEPKVTEPEASKPALSQSTVKPATTPEPAKAPAATKTIIEKPSTDVTSKPSTRAVQEPAVQKKPLAQDTTEESSAKRVNEPSTDVAEKPSADTPTQIVEQSSTDSKRPPQDLQRWKAVLRKLEHAHEQGNANKLATLFSKNGRENSLIGRDDILVFYSQQFRKTADRTVRYKTTSHRSKFSLDTLSAIIEGEMISDLIIIDKGKRSKKTAKFQLVLELIDDEYKIVSLDTERTWQ